MSTPSRADLAAFWADEPVLFNPPEGQEGPQERPGASGWRGSGPDAERRREAHTAGSGVERCKCGETVPTDCAHKAGCRAWAEHLALLDAYHHQPCMRPDPLDPEETT